MRKAKTVDLKRDVMTLKDAFERALEKKKKYIAGLLAELEEAEEQYSMAFRAQMENIDKMMNIHKSRLDDHQEIRLDLALIHNTEIIFLYQSNYDYVKL